MPKPPALHRLEGLLELSDEQIAARTEVRPAPVTWQCASAAAIAKQFAERAERLFLCDAQRLRLLKTYTGIAVAHACANYTTERQYRQALFSGTDSHRWPVKSDLMRCLTGLGGLGKSALVEALGRLVASLPVQIDGVGEVAMDVVWRMKFTNGRRLRSLVHPTLEMKGQVAQKTEDAVLHKLRTLSWRDFCSLIVVDESQRGSAGPGYVTLLETLLDVATIGPSVVWVTNFDLHWKIVERASDQWRQRLLHQVDSLLPDQPESPAYGAFVDELVKITGGALIASDINVIAQMCHAYTFSIRRYTVALMRVVIECGGMRSGRCRALELDSGEWLRCAFESPEYAANREAVKALREQHDGVRRRSDRSTRHPDPSLDGVFFDEVSRGPSLREGSTRSGEVREPKALERRSPTKVAPTRPRRYQRASTASLKETAEDLERRGPL